MLDLAQMTIWLVRRSDWEGSSWDLFFPSFYLFWAMVARNIIQHLASLLLSSWEDATSMADTVPEKYDTDIVHVWLWFPYVLEEKAWSCTLFHA